MKLTKTVVDKAFYDGVSGSRDVRWDDELPGFGVRIYPSGKKTYVLSYRIHGRKRLISIGQCNVIPIDEARRQVRMHLGDIARAIDPLESKASKLGGPTVGELCDAFIERHAKPHKRSWKEDVRKLNAYVLPVWRDRKVKSVKLNDVMMLHHKIGERSHVEANRTVTLLGTIFEKGRIWGFIESELANPARGLVKFKEHSRERWVHKEELPRLREAIDQDSNLYARAAIWLYLLVGVRKSELLKARWEHVDFDRREMKLPNTKAGNDHYVPLSNAAVSVLQSLPREEGNPFILVGKVRGKHLVNISKPWGRMRKAAGVEDVRLHDLRRTVGSWMAQEGHSLHLIGRVLNHASSETTKIYARFGQKEVRAALEIHGESILQTSLLPARAEQKEPIV